MKSLFIERIDERAELPQYKHIADSGMDVKSLEDHVLQGKGGRHTFRLGIKAEIPHGFEIQVRPRSGLAKERGVFAVFGTVDEGYRGEICVTMVNTSRKDYEVKAGDRIAQLVVAPVTRVFVVECDSVLDCTDRGSDGFGSTGGELMGFEYCIKFFNKKTGKCTGSDIEHFKTYEQAAHSLIGIRPFKGEKAVIMKREVGEWKEADDEQ